MSKALSRSAPIVLLVERSLAVLALALSVAIGASVIVLPADRMLVDSVLSGLIVTGDMPDLSSLERP